MKLAVATPEDPDIALVQEYAAREREAAVSIAPVVLRVYRREGPAGSERGAFRHLAERLGLSAAHAMRLVNLGIAIEKLPVLRVNVCDGVVPIETGATL